MTRVPVVGIVACLLPDFGIGFQGSLPWRLSKEMKFFRQTTSSTFDSNKKNVVLMGRKTWESIPEKFRPLPNRINVVISRSFSIDLVKSQDQTCYQCSSVAESIQKINAKMAHEVERIYIIGGGEIYNDSIGLIDHWLITQITCPTNSTENQPDPAPKVDTFLDKRKLLANFQEDEHCDLAKFLPFDIDPSSKTEVASSNGTRYKNEEKGLQFEFTLWNKK